MVLLLKIKLHDAGQSEFQVTANARQNDNCPQGISQVSQTSIDNPIPQKTNMIGKPCNNDIHSNISFHFACKY